jgi:hypothetical protein
MAPKVDWAGNRLAASATRQHARRSRGATRRRKRSEEEKPRMWLPFKKSSRKKRCLFAFELFAFQMYRLRRCTLGNF